MRFITLFRRTYVGAQVLLGAGTSPH